MKSLVKFLSKSLDLHSASLEGIKKEVIPFTEAATMVVLDAVPVVDQFRNRLLSDEQFRNSMERWERAKAPPPGISAANRGLDVAIEMLKKAAGMPEDDIHEEEKKYSDEMDA